MLINSKSVRKLRAVRPEVFAKFSTATEPSSRLRVAPVYSFLPLCVTFLYGM